MQVIVDKHTVTIIKNEIVNEGEYNVQSCNFQFSSDYDGLPKIAIFKTGTVTKQIMLSGNTCITPEEVLQTTGIVGLGVYAYQTDGDNLTLRYSPTPAVFTVEPGSYDEGDAPTPPTPSVIEQLQEEITQNANNITSLQNVTSTHTTQIGTLQTDVNNIKAEQITQNTNISKNADDIATLNNNLTNYSLITETGSQIVLNVNPSNYQMTAILKDKNGNVIYTSNVIDLPIESMIVNVTYDSTTKEIVFTLQNGTTLRVSVADLVSGLVSTDELNTILASYYTKAEIDTLLSGKVDTTTYTQGQATQDTNIQNNADSIENIESLIEQMPTVSGQGIDISLQDVYNYRLMKFLPQGNSSQESTTGKNLLPITNQDFTINDVRFQAINGKIKVSGTASANITGFIMRDNNCFPIMLDAGTYYLSRNLTNTTTGLLKQTGGDPVASLTSTSTAKSVSFTLNETTQLYFFFYIPNGTTKDDTFEIMVSTNDGDWEPYTGGISAPNPSYPFPVKSVTGENVLKISNSDNTETQTYPISLGNIELNSSPDGTIRDGIMGSSDVSYNLLDYTKWASGSILDNGSESTNVFNAKSTNYIPVLPNTTYSFVTANNITNLRLNEYTNIKTHIQRIVASGTNKLTITTTANTHYLRWSLNYNNATTITEELLKELDLMLIKGSEAKPYFPYGQVGMWYKREYIRKISLKISNMNNSEAYPGWKGVTQIKEDYPNANGTPLSMKTFYMCNMTTFDMNGISINTSASNSVLYFRKSIMYDMTQTEWKSQYGDLNVILYYGLETPTDIPITDTTLINQLNDIYNNAHSYNGVTNITTTYASGNEQMYLDIEALAKSGSSTTETDPIFSASASSGITSSDISNWNGKASTTYVDTAIANAITNTLGGNF